MVAWALKINLRVLLYGFLNNVNFYEVGWEHVNDTECVH